MTLTFYPHDINKNTVTLVWTHDQNTKTTYKVEVQNNLQSRSTGTYVLHKNLTYYYVW